MPEAKLHIGNKTAAWLHRELIEKKFISPVGLSILAIIVAGLGVLFTDKDFVLIPFILIGVFIGVILLYYCIVKPLTGFYITTSIAFFAFYPSHLFGLDLPISSGVEVLTLFLYIGTYVYTKKNAAPKGGLISTSISVTLIIYSGYLICEAFNTNVPNVNGWFFSTKRYFVYILLYIIAYDLIDTTEKFKYFFKYWIKFSFAAALYGCYQKWFGYLPMELHYIMRSPVEYKLLYQGGSLRIFSFLSDVVSFGVLCGSMAVITLLLAINEKIKKTKYILWFFTIIFVLGMLYSGTRTTYFMIPAGLALYVLLTIQSKRTLIIIFGSFMAVFLIMFLPINNGPLNRFRSAFNSKDESLNVRDMNRHYIQPYIYKHPFGGGISSTGGEGKHYYPDHPLAGFPPDSGYLKFALEQGWIGLLLIVIYNLSIFYQGIHSYFRMKDKTYKLYMATLLAALFSIIITQYAQVSIGQLPYTIFIFAALSLIKRLKEFDDAKAKQTPIDAVIPLTN